MNPLIAVLCARRKKDLKALCAKETIKGQDLVGVILAAKSGLIPWHHLISRHEFIPKDLRVSGDEIAAIPKERMAVGSPIPKILDKFIKGIDARRLLVGHLFYTPSHTNWHLLYFDQRDFAERNNHWIGGSHLHIVNHLTTNRSVTKAWYDFHASDNPILRGSLHIRWDRQRDRAAEPAVELHTNRRAPP